MQRMMALVLGTLAFLPVLGQWSGGTLVQSSGPLVGPFSMLSTDLSGLQVRVVAPAVSWSGSHRMPRATNWNWTWSVLEVDPCYARQSARMRFHVDLMEGWEVSVALGGVRELWPEVGQIRWRPDALMCLSIDLDEMRAMAWLDWGEGWDLPAPTRRVSGGVTFSKTWVDWTASALLGSGGFSGQVHRVVGESWGWHVGWVGQEGRLLIGFDWRFSTKGRASCQFGESGWGAPSWIGHATW
jgi:hypothetical protein